MNTKYRGKENKINILTRALTSITMQLIYCLNKNNHIFLSEINSLADYY